MNGPAGQPGRAATTVDVEGGRFAGVLAEEASGLGAVFAGAANVIMQLALPPVGWAVIESRVESGQVTRHPWKRFRTTFTYLAVAMMGSDLERVRFRRALDAVHAQVRSLPDSPVAYNAFDPRLQLWVAACLYQGTVDVRQALRGPLDGERADALYRGSARFATTLQVPTSMWPEDREAFGRYWEEMVGQISLAPPVRRYLENLVQLHHLPWVLRWPFARFSRFVTAGFLHPPFREAMGWTWTPADQARFERLLAAAGAFERRLPRAVRAFPFNWFLRDLRRRLRLGLPLV